MKIFNSKAIFTSVLISLVMFTPIVSAQEHSNGWLINDTPFGSNCSDSKCDPNTCPSKCGQSPNEICRCVGNISTYGSQYGAYVCGGDSNSLCIKNACVDNTNISLGATCTGQTFFTPYFTTMLNFTSVPVPALSNSTQTPVTPTTQTNYLEMIMNILTASLNSLGIKYS